MRILILQTGGTIDKDYPKRNGGYAFEITESAALRVVKRIQTTVDFQFKSICRLDSQDINEQNRKDLVAACQSSDVTHILITHGTDTLIKTAKYLDLHVTDKVIVLTGSFKPETFKDSDAEFNLGFAVGCLSTMTSQGVWVAMNCSLFKHSEVAKNENSGNFERK